MKIPKYWARGFYSTQTHTGKPVNFSCWHWSDRSYEDALDQAQQRARRMAAIYINGQRLDRYTYGERPIREEVVEVLSNSWNELGIITRNAYGALVLNAPKAMFVDIDFKPGEGKPRGLFVKSGPPEANYLPAIEQWVRRNPSLGLRVYRTAAGLRCLVTSDTFDPTHPSTLSMMQALGSDPLYMHLCRQQESFRARLTPKPWRCGVTMPPGRYPWDSPLAERQHRQWQAEYTQTAASYAVCRLVASYGDARVHSELEPIVALHDRYCGVASNLSLA